MTISTNNSQGLKETGLSEEEARGGEKEWKEEMKGRWEERKRGKGEERMGRGEMREVGGKG